MRRLSIVLCALLLSSVAFGQQVRSREAGLEELRMLLRQAGYEAFSFDLREFLADRYDVTVRVKEYADGRDLECDRVFYLRSNKLMLTDFPAESRDGIRPDEMADPTTGTYRQAERLTVGFYPSGADSLASVVFDLAGMATSRAQLPLRGLARPGAEERTPFYRYLVRPFRLDAPLGEGRFVPLLLFGSMWYDARSGIFRFCGEREIAPDLSSEIVGRVPHFFVIGLELTRRQE